MPAETPAAIAAKLNQGPGAYARSPDVRENMLARGLEPVSQSPEAFSKYTQSEIAKCAGMVKAYGAKPE